MPRCPRCGSYNAEGKNGNNGNECNLIWWPGADGPIFPGGGPIKIKIYICLECGIEFSF